MPSDPNKFCTSPCSECPWRKDRIGQFPPERFVSLANTAYDLSSYIFSCHKSAEEAPVICAGFLMNGSTHNMAIRMMAMRKEIETGDVSDGGHELHETYEDMAIANGVDEDHPALRACRSLKD